MSRLLRIELRVPVPRLSLGCSSREFEPSREEDVPRLMRFLTPAFEHLHYSTLVGDTDTPENLKAAGKRHLHAWQEHAKHTEIPMDIPTPPLATRPSSRQPSGLSTTTNDLKRNTCNQATSFRPHGWSLRLVLFSDHHLEMKSSLTILVRLSRSRLPLMELTRKE